MDHVEQGTVYFQSDAMEGVEEETAHRNLLTLPPAALSVMEADDIDKGSPEQGTSNPAEATPEVPRTELKGPSIRKPGSKYDKRKQAGLCYRCCRRATPGLSECERCLDNLKEYARRRRQQAEKDGACARCMNRPRSPGFKTCDDCRAINTDRSVRVREARRAGGMCSICGQLPVNPGTKSCEPCRDRVTNCRREERRRKRSMRPEARAEGDHAT